MFKHNHAKTGQKRSTAKQARPQKTTHHNSPQAVLQRAQATPSLLTPQDIIQLQRTVGNRAVQQLLTQSPQKRPMPRLSPIQRSGLFPIPSPQKIQHKTAQLKGTLGSLQRNPLSWWRRKKKGNKLSMGDLKNLRMIRHQAPDRSHLQKDTVGIVRPNDLFYGLAAHRGATLDRLSRSGGNRRMRTIDEYNAETGVVSGNVSVEDVYRVRKALADPENWTNYLTASKHPYPNGDELKAYQERKPNKLNNAQKWMTFLVDNEERIGLYDLGDPASGLQKIQARWHMNLVETHPDLQPEDIHRLLNYATDDDEAVEKDISDMRERGMYMAAYKWIERAFLRRTSKLGIEFAISPMGLNAHVHFNLASSRHLGGIDYESVPNGIPQDIADYDQNNNQRVEKITESEWRHVLRLRERGDVPIFSYSESKT